MGLVMEVDEVEALRREGGQPRRDRLSVNLESDRERLQGLGADEDHVPATGDAEQIRRGSLPVSVIIQEVTDLLQLGLPDAATARTQT